MIAEFQALFTQQMEDIDELISRRLRSHQTDLTRNIRGTLPGKYLPTTGNTGSGYTPAAHDINSSTLHTGYPLTVDHGGTNLTSLTANGIMYASGTTALATSSNLVYSGGFLGVGTSSPGTMVHGVLTNATPAGVDDVITAAHNSSNTPVVGFGGAVLFRLQSSTTVDQLAGRLRYAWSTATHASRAAKGSLTAYSTSTERECIAWEANSSAPLVGFLGASPAIRQVVSGNNGGLAGLTGFLTALATLGLITDSTTNSDTIATLGAANTFTALNTFNAHINASRVGINVTGTPAALLDIQASGSAQSILFHTESDSLNSVMQFQDNSPSQARVLAINFLNSASASRGQVAYLMASDALRFNAAGATAIQIDSSQNVGVGTTAPDTRLHVLLSSAATNAVTNIGTIGHNSSGTAAAGFGAGISIQLESSTTNARDAARMTVEWATATDASRAARGKLTAYYTSTEREVLRWEANSTVPMIGFLGAAAIAKPAAYTLAGSATRTMPTDPSGAYTGINNAQAGTPYAQLTDLNTLRGVVSSLEGVIRQLLTDLGAGGAGYGLVQ